MKKIIIAIGGGEIKDLETLPIDKEIVKLANKKRPKALFIPTASNDSVEYFNTFKKVYGEILECKTEVLYLIKENPSQKEIREKILNSNIIYVGGGNTKEMIRIWTEKRVDKFLKKAYERGIILSGLSAGAICWFKYGCSDSPRFSNKKDKSLIRIKGLGLIKATLSPHHIREKNRDKGLDKIMKKTKGIGIALDDNCAIEIIDKRYRIINSKKEAGAKKVYSSNERIKKEKIKMQERFKPLKDLLKIEEE